MACEVWLSRLGAQLWAVLAEDGRPAEVRVEPPGPPGPRAGAVYVARVLRGVPELGAAFVDLGDGVEGYLEAGDLPGTDEPRERLRRLRAGASIVVQVRREGLRGKSPRVRSSIELAGALLSYRTCGRGGRVSRRIEESRTRERLMAWVRDRDGVVLRTAARHVAPDEIEREWERLRERAAEIAAAAERRTAPALLAAAPGEIERTLHDAAGRDLRAVIVETDGDERAARALLDACPTTRAVELYRHEAAVPLFRERGLHELLDAAHRRRLHLPSGGSIVIEPTEALVAIDVNAASVRGGTERAAATETVNVEAAREIARQIRLRDLGGTILIDFIGTERSASRPPVEAALRQALRPDRRSLRIAGWTPLGLCEIARRRVGMPWTALVGTARRPTAWGVAARILAAPRKPAARYRARLDAAAAEALRLSCEGAEPPVALEIEVHDRGLARFELQRID